MNLLDMFSDEDGATALEYGLMAAAIAGVLIAIAFVMGGRVNNKLNTLAQHL